MATQPQTLGRTAEQLAPVPGHGDLFRRDHVPHLAGVGAGGAVSPQAGLGLRVDHVDEVGDLTRQPGVVRRGRRQQVDP